MPKNIIIERIKKHFPVWTKVLSKELICYSKILTFRKPADIDFFMVGVMKSGTTSLFNYLIENPHIFPPLYKEIHYFDDRPHRSMRWYRANFISESKKSRVQKEIGERVITGEATPTYIFKRSIAEKIKKNFPDTKVIIMIRNPVSRAYSEYNFIKRFYKINDDFYTYVKKEIDWINNQKFKHIEDIYQKYSKEPTVLRGVYHWYIQDYIEIFGKENVLVVNSDIFFKNTAEMYKLTMEFIGAKYIPRDKFEKYDQGNKYNIMPDDAKVILSDFYRPHNKKLAELLGKELYWDK